MNEQTQNTQQTNMNWLSEELEDTSTQNVNFGEKLPAMKFEENKIAVLQIDFTNKFNKYTGEQSGKQVIKAIIPVLHNGERKNWWLSVRNPVYRELLLLGASGVTQVNVLQTGNQANTRYILVK